MKILLHVDEPEKWKLALENAGNALKEAERIGQDFIIEIVANSAAVKYLKQETAKSEGLFDTIDQLATQAVRFMACRNAMNSNGLRESDMIPFVNIVPAGVVEIAQRQNDGYAYIKP